jgi:hypothetical protein
MHPDREIRSPAVTEDELELFYVSTVQGSSSGYYRSVRTSRSQAFPVAEPVPELDALCAGLLPEAAWAIDVSLNGLRAYITCGLPTSEIPIQLATRSDRTTPFVLERVVGQMGVSVAVDASELTAYSSGYLSFPGPPLVARRDSLADEFVGATPIPGLESQTLVAPEISRDGLTIYGADGNRLGFSERTGPSEPFGPFAEFPFIATFTATGAPEMSADCRRLYFVGIYPNGGPWALHVIER